MISATAAAHNPPPRLKNEGLILERVQHHLRQAVAVGTVAEVTIRLRIGRGGGLSRSKVGVAVEYEFLEDLDAL